MNQENNIDIIITQTLGEHSIKVELLRVDPDDANELMLEAFDAIEGKSDE